MRGLFLSVLCVCGLALASLSTVKACDAYAQVIIPQQQYFVQPQAVVLQPQIAKVQAQATVQAYAAPVVAAPVVAAPVQAYAAPVLAVEQPRRLFRFRNRSVAKSVVRY